MRDDGDGLRRLLIVSNVDTALLVMGLDHDFNLRRLERYLALVRVAGVGALVVLTKADARDADARALARCRGARLLPAGGRDLAVDARAPSASAMLSRHGSAPGRRWCWSVERRRQEHADQHADRRGGAGHRRACAPTTAAAATPPRRARCTRCRAAPASSTRRGCARCGSTPTRTTVEQAFDDIAQLASQCRFRDCRAPREPGCAVRDGVPRQRLANFHKLKREARRDSMTVLERREQIAMWKARGREATARMKAKRY